MLILAEDITIHLVVLRESFHMYARSRGGKAVSKNYNAYSGNVVGYEAIDCPNEKERIGWSKERP